MGTWLGRLRETQGTLQRGRREEKTSLGVPEDTVLRSPFGLSGRDCEVPGGTKWEKTSQTVLLRGAWVYSMEVGA